MPHGNRYPALRHRPRFPFARPYAPPIVEYYVPPSVTYVDRPVSLGQARQGFRMMWVLLLGLLLLILAVVLLKQ
jgi:hypothetical protein